MRAMGANSGGPSVSAAPAQPPPSSSASSGNLLATLRSAGMAAGRVLGILVEEGNRLEVKSPLVGRLWAAMWTHRAMHLLAPPGSGAVVESPATTSAAVVDKASAAGAGGGSSRGSTAVGSKRKAEVVAESGAVSKKRSTGDSDGYRPSWDTCASLAVEAARVARIAGDNPLATRVLAAMRACEAWMQEALQLLDTPEARAAVDTAHAQEAAAKKQAKGKARARAAASAPSAGSTTESGTLVSTHGQGPVDSDGAGSGTPAVGDATVHPTAAAPGPSGPPLAERAQALLDSCARLPVIVKEKDAFAPADPSAMLLLLKSLL